MNATVGMLGKKLARNTARADAYEAAFVAWNDALKSYDGKRIDEAAKSYKEATQHLQEIEPFTPGEKAMFMQIKGIYQKQLQLQLGHTVQDETTKKLETQLSQAILVMDNMQIALDWLKSDQVLSSRGNVIAPVFSPYELRHPETAVSTWLGAAYKAETGHNPLQERLDHIDQIASETKRTANYEVARTRYNATIDQWNGLVKEIDAATPSLAMEEKIAANLKAKMANGTLTAQDIEETNVQIARNNETKKHDLAVLERYEHKVVELKTEAAQKASSGQQYAAFFKQCPIPFDAMAAHLHALETQLGTETASLLQQQLDAAQHYLAAKGTGSPSPAPSAVKNPTNAQKLQTLIDQNPSLRADISHLAANYHQAINPDGKLVADPSTTLNVGDEELKTIMTQLGGKLQSAGILPNSQDTPAISPGARARTNPEGQKPGRTMG